MNELNKKFKEYRISLNMTQEDLYQKSGVSLYTIKKFEAGADIKVSTLNKLLIAMGFDNVFDTLIPDVTDRPSYRSISNIEKKRKRASKIRKNSDWSWGEQ